MKSTDIPKLVKYEGKEYSVVYAKGRIASHDYMYKLRCIETEKLLEELVKPEDVEEV